ncbi:transposase [Bacillus sp. FJAT-47783]|uniref:transposase n=1 Tax=Bacillus sp. FJAT-47783 TaxID=2922712 RepID=UPI001FACC8E4|nr:transposase [Bacillus sp. FJAT-47783]
MDYRTQRSNVGFIHMHQNLAIVPVRDEEAIQSALSCVKGTIQQAVSDLAPAMAKAIQCVFPSSIHVLDHFHIIPRVLINQ